MNDDDTFRIDRRHLLQTGAATLFVLQGGAAITGQMPVIASALAQPAVAAMPVSRYVLARLVQHNCKALFGIPGKTCEDLFDDAAKMAASGDFKLVVTATDAEAGFAADAYARFRGLGAVAVTYGVGTLSLVAAVAGAYVERSPLVVINGGPSDDPDISTQDEEGTLFTHGIGRVDADLEAMRAVTAFAERVARKEDAARIIDEALAIAMREQRPVYIEIAKNVWKATIAAPAAPISVEPPVIPGDPETARQIIDRLAAAARPALLVGIEVQRYRLQDDVRSLINKLKIPYATTLLAKSVIADTTPGFIGVYGGTSAPPSVRKVIEDADTLVTLGCVLGRSYRRLVNLRRGQMIRLGEGRALFGTAAPTSAGLASVVREMRRLPFTVRPSLIDSTRLPGLSFDQRRRSIPVAPSPGSEPGIGYDELARVVSDFSSADFITISDTSLSMYPLADGNVVGRDGYLCNAVYQSIGYSVPAALGAGLAQARRPLVVCGDGGFQLSAQALSTLVRQSVRAIVIVLDNSLYGIEQLLIDQSYFGNTNRRPGAVLALNRWDYAKLAAAFNVPHTATAADVAQLQQALVRGRDASGPMMISVRIKPHDRPRHIVLS